MHSESPSVHKAVIIGAALFFVAFVLCMRWQTGGPGRPPDPSRQLATPRAKPEYGVVVEKEIQEGQPVFRVHRENDDAKINALLAISGDPSIEVGERVIITFYELRVHDKDAFLFIAQKVKAE